MLQIVKRLQAELGSPRPTIGFAALTPLAHGKPFEDSTAQSRMVPRANGYSRRYSKQALARIDTQAMAAALDGVDGSPALPPKPLTMASISEPSSTSFSSNFSAT